MTDKTKSEQPVLKVESVRFGELEIPEDSIIHFPVGIIGFPSQHRYVLIEHKPPFSWLHSIDDPHLAFVVVDGMEFGENYRLTPPVGNKDIELGDNDEFAILVIVTVRSDPKASTANLKAPLFVNLRNRMGIQVIYDDSRLSTRFPLWGEENESGKE